MVKLAKSLIINFITFGLRKEEEHEREDPHFNC